MNWKRLLSWVVCAAMLLTLLPAGVLSLSAEETAVDVSRLTRYGRTYVTGDTLYLYWTNAGFSFRFNGTGATATVTSNNQTEIYWGYLNVYVDGEFAPSKTICLTQATQTVTLAEGLPAGEHTIEVRKRNEAGYGGSATIGVKTLTVTNGEFLDPPAAPTRQIEVIGDSITGGFGNLDPNGSVDRFTTEMQEGTMTYAVLAAKELGANASIVSRSGIGFCITSGRDSIYDYYTKTAVVPSSAVGSTAEWDFAANPSDVVVINLGTNDAGWGLSSAKVTEDAVSLLELVREKNPNAVIIWTYGMMGSTLQSALQAAVQQRVNAGDSKVFYLPLENYVSTTEGVGTHGHPTIQTDINRSIVLAEFIADKTGWEVDGKPMLQAQLQWSAQYNTEANLANYTAMSAKKFTDAIDAGEALLTDTTATADDYVAAAETVWTTSYSLVDKGDMSEEYTVIDPCETTSGVGFGGAGSLDTTDFMAGSACLSSTGSSGTIAINHQNAYNVTLPTDWQEWYLEAWLYVSDPTAIPAGSCLEVSESVDSTEVAWELNALGLKAGWNKLQLEMGASHTNMSRDQLKAIKNIRLFVVNVTKELTVKIDHIVLAKGKAAANITAWETALEDAEELLAEEENEELRAAYELAQTALSQADVDVFTARLNEVIETVKSITGDSIVVGENLDKITTYGRTFTNANGALGLYWTNSGFSFRFNGAGATATLITNNTSPTYYGYLNVYVDGESTPSKTICLEKASEVYTLAEGLPVGEHTIEVRKRNEAAYGGSATISVQTLTISDGEFLDPPAAPAYTIEVIGDSITSGFGNMVTDGGTGLNFSTATQDGTMTYATLAAKELGANVSILSRSGIGYCQEVAGMDSFYNFYTKTAMLPGASQSGEVWDFAANPNDVVIINLGTNDFNNGATTAKLKNGAIDFIKLVRKNNPNAVIIWTYGMMGNGAQPALEAAVDQLVKAGDDKLFYLPLDAFVRATEGQGVHGHPSIQANINRSLVLAEFIAEKTGWEVDAKPMLQAQLQDSAQYNNETFLAAYAPLSVKRFTDAIAAGEALLADANATSDDFAAAADAIWKAYLALPLAVEEEPTGMLGDVNGDDKVNTSDARYILQFAAEKIGEADLDMSMADTDGNGKVNTTDARYILQLAAEKIDKLPAEA